MLTTNIFNEFKYVGIGLEYTTNSKIYSTPYKYHIKTVVGRGMYV